VRNVAAELPGTSFLRRDEIVVIGAHYDSAVDTPGADDNASGVAALLALANAFVATENERTLRFVGFVNEEPPYFKTDQMGSLVYARECKGNEEDVVAMIALETMAYFSDEPNSQNYPKMIADDYPTVGNFIAFVGNLDSKKLVHQTHAAFQAATEFPAEKGVFPGFVQGVGWSDHWSFWESGYPALMVTDTALFRNPHYHKPTDTVEKLDFDRLAEVVVGLVAVVERLANPDAAAKADAALKKK
jgi:Zn-dependent M28 family amino/carboxypeptidase